MPDVENSKVNIDKVNIDKVNKEIPDLSAEDFSASVALPSEDSSAQPDEGLTVVKASDLPPAEEVLVHHARGFVAFKNIKDKKGTTVVKKGEKLAFKMVEVLAKKEISEVAKTFEDVEELISSKQVIQDISKLVDSFEDLRAIENEAQCHSVINDLGYSVNLPPEIKYYLTIMSRHYSELYRKSLFCAWFATLLAQQQKQGKAHQKEAFLVGLLHDLGMLFLPKEVQGKRNHFTPTEWQWYQRHTVYSKVVIQEVWPNQNDLLRAILLHHERGGWFRVSLCVHR